MDLFESVREKASQLHDTIVQLGSDPLKPHALVEAAVAHLGLSLEWVEPGDPTLKGAYALHDEQLGLLCCAKLPDMSERALAVAHEIGHVSLHARSSLCQAEDIDPSRSTEAAPIGLERVEDYGAHERRELQANVFGRELLFPRALARRLHVEEALGPITIAERLQLPKDLVRQQILDALLLPQLPEQSSAAVSTLVQDESQDIAAAHRGCAFLLQAGPGAGKTRTLVKRVLSLLAENVDPASILVLTFSNRAAGELAERITSHAPDAAPRIWIGTFHAFGLDLIRRYHAKLDLPADPTLFDRSDAIEVLEEILPTLPLVHYKNLWDPAMILRDIVNTISRAKDELVGPSRYRELCEGMRSNAQTSDERVAAEKAREVADVYELYEEALRSRRSVDFGDLIMRPTLLLESDSNLRMQLQLRHRHILVDEYQDVNRASTRLLRAIAGDGQRLWVVGDARQSIYRFRGASSVNLPRFLKEYPNAQTARLGINYRSSREVLDLVERFAVDMDASRGMLPLQMQAARGPTGRRPQMRTYTYKDNELSGIAATIRELEAAGVPLRDQAVLCRTNSRLNEIAAGLEARDIPVLHLGSLFERSEIRDCLSLLTFAIDPYAPGLVRVATLPRYRMSLQDVQIATQACRSTPGAAIPKLAQVATDHRLSPEGAASLIRLTNDLAGLSAGSTSWEYLTSWLLDRTRHVVELSNDDTVGGRMRGVALWQFLNFVRTPGPLVRGPPIRRTLDRVRQLVLLAEERDLRQVPASALRMDAVRLMTVHGSKGLEFEAVHLPGMSITSFPSNFQGQRCPPPLGMIDENEAAGVDPMKSAHAREEECLFFVASSRARIHLQLTRFTKQDNGQKRNPSPYLARIAGYIDEAAAAEIALAADAVRETRIAVNWLQNWNPTDEDIRQYQKCARRFFYTRVLRLGKAYKPTAFSLTHDRLYEFIEWLAETRQTGEPTLETAQAQFELIWLERGPTQHAYAEQYHRLASQLVVTLVRMGAGRRFQSAEPLALDLPNGRVLVHPDEIAKLPDGAIALRRVHTGRKRKDEYDRIEYTLYLLAGRAQYGEGCRFESIHLTDGDTVHEVSLTQTRLDNREEQANTLLAELRHGAFPPRPDAMMCPRCPHFFVCDAAPSGALTPHA